MAEGDRARWDARWSGVEPGAPSPFLVALDDVLPRAGRALDVAGGTGRNALWLARRGLDVTVADVSPAGLAQARAAAARAGVALRLVEVDLEQSPLPAGPFAVVVSIDFLSRALFAEFPRVLAPGGVLVYVQATRRNLERHPHPGARFLLDDGELPSLLTGLDVVRYEEDWFGDRHEARLVARRPARG
jgi:SAM-dependent methyltransferase